MYKNVKELKRIARGNLQGNYMGVIRAFVFCNLIVSIVEMPFSMMTNDDYFSTQNIIYYIATILISIVSVVLTAGQLRLHMTLSRTGEIHPSELFVPFKYYSNVFILTELILFGLNILCVLPLAGAVYIVYSSKDLSLYMVALLLCIISAVLMLFLCVMFDLVYFVLNDNEELSAFGALKTTLQMIKSHKGRYLYLLLSFIPMLILVALSFGVAAFWVQPYIIQTTTVFYLDVKGELPEILEKRKSTGPVPTPIAFDSYI